MHSRLGLGLFASVLLAAGLLMMKSRSAKLPAARAGKMFHSILVWIRDPVWTAGLGIQAIGYAVYIVSLSDAPVSLVAVVMQAGIGLFVVLAVLFLHERASASEWAGIVGIAVAMVMLAQSLKGGATQGHATTLALIHSDRNLHYCSPRCPMHLHGCIVTVRQPRSRRGSPSAWPAFYTRKALTDSFIAQTGSAVMVRVFADQWVYFTIGANMAGLILLQNSFYSARGIIAMPLSSAISNVVPILGGMAAFGETLPPEPTAALLRITAFALTIASSALLATGRSCSLGEIPLIGGTVSS